MARRKLILARCGRPVGRKRCVRPAKHRGVCSLRSADLEGAGRAARALVAHVKTQAVVMQRPRANWQAQLEAVGAATTQAEAFCDLVCDIGLGRAGELLERMRGLGAELASISELGA